MVRMNGKKLFCCLTISGLLLSLMAEKSSALILRGIDPLTDVQSVSRTTNGQSFATNVSPTGTIFGTVTRRLRLNVTQSNRNTATARIPISPQEGNNGLSLSTDVGMDAATTVLYGNTRLNTTVPIITNAVNFLTPVDGITPDRIQFNDVFFDLGGTLTLTLASGTGTGRVTRSSTQTLSAGFLGRVDFLFSAFSGINFNAVNGFTYTFDPVLNGDASLRLNGLGDARPEPQPATTPEPTTMLGLFAVGGVGLLKVLKNKKS